jgi:hypothetical protein
MRIGSSVIAVIVTGMAIAGWIILSNYFIISPINVLFVASSLLLLGIAVLMLPWFQRIEILPGELGGARAFRERITRDAEITGSQGFALLKEYHAQGLAQSKISFWFSLVFASLGFVIIMVSVVKVLSSPSGDWYETIGKPSVTLVSGTVVSAVGALFFVQSNRARQLMTEFFDKLRTDRKLDEALQLTRSIEDPVVSSHLKAVLALPFVDAKIEQPTVGAILGENPPVREAKTSEQNEPMPKHS